MENKIWLIAVRWIRKRRGRIIHTPIRKMVSVNKKGPPKVVAPKKETKAKGFCSPRFLPRNGGPLKPRRRFIWI